MSKNKKNPDLDTFFRNAKTWRAEFELLREIVVGCELEEVLKWGWPCYALEDRNIVLMHGFKNYCALLFFKGALLKDPAGVLIQQTANVQAGRQMRFTSAEQIAASGNIVKSYVLEAIAAEKSGAKVKLKATEEFAMPEAFRSRLKSDPTLKAAFSALTPGRQKAYLLHFSAAKQEKTVLARIEKAVQPILDGKGLDD